MPVCVSFGIFEKNDEKVEFVVDNTLEEESVMKGAVSICTNIFGEISYMRMNTEAMIGLNDIQNLILHVFIGGDGKKIRITKKSNAELD